MRLMSASFDLSSSVASESLRSGGGSSEVFGTYALPVSAWYFDCNSKNSLCQSHWSPPGAPALPEPKVTVRPFLRCLFCQIACSDVPMAGDELPLLEG